MKILVIGGVAAGTKTAAKLKREDRAAEVTVLAKDKDISYAGCGLPYYVGGVIADKASLIVNTPAKFSALTGAKVLTGKEAVALDRAAKTVTAADVETGEQAVYEYDKLVIAVGASSRDGQAEIDLASGAQQHHSVSTIMLLLVKTQISEAISMAARTVASASRSECRCSARAADRA